MEKSDLRRILNTLDDIDQIIEENGKLEFNYRKFVSVSINPDNLTALFSGVIYKSKLFGNGKIAKAYKAWVSRFVTLHPVLYKGLKPANVGVGHCFPMFFEENTLFLLQDMLKSFYSDFLPSIRQYMKEDYSTIVK